MTIIDKHIISFSGGKDSTAMLLMMLEKGMQIDEIIFCDTSVEFPEMYEHIEKVKKYINLPITTLKNEYNFEYYMFDYVKKKGKNKGKKGYSWSDWRVKWCTYFLKRKPINQYLGRYKDLEIYEYHGIALDEIERTDKNNDGRNIKYPLVDWQMTGADALEYCYSKGFNWSGLYEKFDRVSCYLCPLQRLKELKVLYTQHPELWAYMKELDKRSIKQFGRKFRPDYSIEELEVKFNNNR